MRRNLKAYIVIFLATFIFYLPIIIKPATFLNRGNDLTQFFYPIYYFVKHQILLDHQIPLWNNLFLSGTPLLPDPQSPIFYPPSIIFLILPIGSAFIISSFLHTFVGGIGSYFLAKDGLKMKQKISIYIAILYVIAPKLSAYIEAGHFGLIEAWTWIPFVFLVTIKTSQKPSYKFSLLLGISMSGLFFTHTVTFFLTGIASGVLFLYLALTTKNQIFSKLKFYILGSLIAFGLSAITLLPQLQWTKLTTRNLLLTKPQVYPVWNSVFELPKVVLFPWLMPGGINNIDTEKWLTFGISITILSIFGFLKSPKKYKLPLVIVIGLITLVSLSTSSPIYAFLINQNWYKLMRIPTRIWIFVPIVAIYLSGYILQFFETQKVKKIYIYLIAAITIIECVFLSWTYILQPASKRQTAPNEVYEYLVSDKDRFRVMCLDRCLDQDRAATYHLELAEGYSTLVQTNYFKHSWQLTNSYWDYYSLPIPPTGVYKYQDLQPEAKYLGEYNIKYVISDHKLNDKDLVLQKSFDKYLVYLNKLARPRSNGNITYYSPNKIDIDTKNIDNNRLILAEVYSPGWNAYLDGNEKVPVMESPIAQRVVSIKNGTKFVEFRYEPTSYKLGKVITLATIILMFIYFVKQNYQGFIKYLKKLVKSIDSSKSSKYKKLFTQLVRKLVLIVCGLIAGFLFLEFLLRSYYFLARHQFAGLQPVHTDLVWIDDPLLGVKLKPNQSGWYVTDSREYHTFITSNSEGWRDTSHSFDKPADTYRIAVLGDSFVESFQVPLEDTFFKQLERKLNSDPETKYKNIEILAFGMGDTGTSQQLLVLQNIIPKYKPDLVVQMFLTSNDFRNNDSILHEKSYFPHHKLNDNGNLILIPPVLRNERPLGKLKSFFKKSVVVQKILKIRQDINVHENEKLKSDNNDYHTDLHIYDETYTPAIRRAVSITQSLIGESKNTADAIGAKYLLIMLANNEQVNSKVWQHYLFTFPAFKNANPDIEKPDRVLKEICHSQDVNCLFMLPYFLEFKKGNPDELTHYYHDGHWTQTGNDIAAEFLYNHLKSLIEEK